MLILRYAEKLLLNTAKSFESSRLREQNKKAKENLLLPFCFLPFNRDLKFLVSIPHRNHLRRRLPLLPRNRRHLRLHRRLTHLPHLELTFLHVCCQSQIPQE